MKVTAIPAPTADPVRVSNFFEKAVEHEESTTKAIYNGVKLAHTKEDWVTWSFLPWFLMEQVEEENIAISLLDKIKIAGGKKPDWVCCVYLIKI